MNAFSEKNVDAAIVRLTAMASRDIEMLRERARSRGLTRLIEACGAELAKRPFAFSTEIATSFERMAAEVRDMELVDAIRYAFSQVLPPSDYEIRFLRWIAAHPGGSYQEALEAYGKGDLGLVIGHLVYDRFGCFRKFMRDGEDQSSILLHKDRTGESVRYMLRPEAGQVLRELGIAVVTVRQSTRISTVAW
jgi:hypothetical protein